MSIIMDMTPLLDFFSASPAAGWRLSDSLFGPRKKTKNDISTLWILLKKLENQNSEAYPAWVEDSLRSLAEGDLKLSHSGVGGTYFVSTGEDQKPLSVFKPVDEEPGAPNNPKKIEGFVPMLPCGNGAHREVAAYLLGKRFVDVPETYFVRATTIDKKIKEGSLQKFAPNDGDCADIGANMFSIDSVHRLGIFDISILNMDRNDENLLVQKFRDGNWKLIPIDHTYCFPNKVNSYFNWHYWSQAKQPFSQEIRSIISTINPLANAQVLLDVGIDEESIRNVIGSTLLLQIAAEKDYNLYQIASMVSGENNALVDMLSLTREMEQCYYQTYYGEESFLSVKKRTRIFKSICEAIIRQKI